MFLDRFKEWIAPTPQPDLKPPAEALPPLNLPTSPHVDQDEIEELEKAVKNASRCNNVAATLSVATSHLAISAEERTRSMLTGLMEAMDRSKGE